MEKEVFFGNPSVVNRQMRHHDDVASLAKLKLNSNRINLIWDQIMNQGENFDLDFTSLVSSPSSYLLEASGSGDSVVIRELIGRLGSICNSNEIAPLPSQNRSANNSQSKQSLSIVANPAHLSFTEDPSFVERAARCSVFCSNGGQFMFPETGTVRIAREESSGSGNSNKRKLTVKEKGKEVPLLSSITAVSNSPKKARVGSLNAKRSQTSKESKCKKDSDKLDGVSSSKKIEGNNTKPHDLAKDYIHVRARRGQATDSHSLAERVRREKISERMKLLQDLVPGCSKVTGKAVMLDEIINYVQLLQRQVEILSMKLATVSPQLDFNIETFGAEDIEVHQNYKLLTTQPVYPIEATSSSFSFANFPEKTSLNSANSLDVETQLNHLSRPSLSMHLPPLEGFVDASSQLGTFWDDDLRTALHMGFSQNQDYHNLISQSFQD